MAKHGANVPPKDNEAPPSEFSRKETLIVRFDSLSSFTVGALVELRPFDRGPKRCRGESVGGTFMSDVQGCIHQQLFPDPPSVTVARRANSRNPVLVRFEMRGTVVDRNLVFVREEESSNERGRHRL